MSDYEEEMSILVVSSLIVFNSSCFKIIGTPVSKMKMDIKEKETFVIKYQ